MKACVRDFMLVKRTLLAFGAVLAVGAAEAVSVGAKKLRDCRLNGNGG